MAREWELEMPDEVMDDNAICLKTTRRREFCRVGIIVHSVLNIGVVVHSFLDICGIAEGSCGIWG